MGNFCTQCGRPLQEGEVCTCTQTGVPTPNPVPAQQAQPQQMNQQAPTQPQQAYQQAPTQPQQAYQQAPTQPKPVSQISIEIKKGFTNILTALKTVFTNPSNAASILSQKENWFPAILFVAVQALLSGLFTIASAGLSFEYISFATMDLVIAFFFTLICSIALSAAMMGLLIVLGKICKESISLKSSLALVGTRMFFVLPFSVLATLTTMINFGIGLFFFLVGEIFALLMIFIAVQQLNQTSTNKAFAITAITFVVLFLLFGIMIAIYMNVNGESLITGGISSSIEDNLQDFLGDYGNFY